MKLEKNTKFERDLDLIIDKITIDVDPVIKKEFFRLRDNLVALYKKRLVKINHSVMELLCVKPLLLKGYSVDIEHLLNGRLSCDVYGEKGEGSLIVEIETGFVPPEHALDPTTYCTARIASKITRYSNYCNKFALGVPPYYLVKIPDAFNKPPRYREMKELLEIKNQCDLYYKNPPVSLEEIRNARLHTIYIIDVDMAIVKEIDPETYLMNTVHCRY
jgi:hypothetical protein